VTNANPSNRLGFAVLLKFFQVEARFPQHPVEVPKAVVHFIAQQLKLTEEDYRRYKWSGVTFKAHRVQIRTFLDYRPVTQSDKQQMKTWLIEKCCRWDYRLKPSKLRSINDFEQLKIEPPVWKQLER
jgi:hypothetical protein